MRGLWDIRLPSALHVCCMCSHRCIPHMPGAVSESTVATSFWLACTSVLLYNESSERQLETHQCSSALAWVYTAALGSALDTFKSSLLSMLPVCQASLSKDACQCQLRAARSLLQTTLQRESAHHAWPPTL